MSPAASQALTSDMGSRYFFKKGYKTKSGISYDYRGTDFIEELVEKGTDLAKKVFWLRLRKHEHDIGTHYKYFYNFRSIWPRLKNYVY